MMFRKTKQDEKSPCWNYFQHTSPKVSRRCCLGYACRWSFGDFVPSSLPQLFSLSPSATLFFILTINVDDSQLAHGEFSVFISTHMQLGYFSKLALNSRADGRRCVWDALNEHEEDEAAQQRVWGCEQVSVREKIKSTLHTRQDQTWGYEYEYISKSLHGIHWINIYWNFTTIV